MVLAVRAAFPSNLKEFRYADAIRFRHRHDDGRSRLPDLAQAGQRAGPASQPLIVSAMIPPSAPRKKRGDLRSKEPDQPSRDRTERPSAEDDAVDAAIKRSIDEFGA